MLRPHQLEALKEQAFDTVHYNKKAKDRLFEYALLYDDAAILKQLASLEPRYGPARNPWEAERKSVFRKHYAAFTSDNPKEIAGKIKLYGTDYRDPYNLTPLLAAALTGAVKTLTWLIENDANRTLTDSLGRSPLQLMLGQVARQPASLKGKLGSLYEQLRTDSLSLRLGERLVKIGAHKVEYLVINYLLAAQKPLLLRKWEEIYFANFVEAADIEDFLSQFPDSIVPAYRKDRRYINAMLARNEVDSQQPYNLRLWIRLKLGNYVLNPDLQIGQGSDWISVYRMMSAEPERRAVDPFAEKFWMHYGVLRGIIEKEKKNQKKTSKKAK